MRVGSGGRKRVRSPITAAQAVRGPARMTARQGSLGLALSCPKHGDAGWSPPAVDKTRVLAREPGNSTGVRTEQA